VVGPVVQVGAEPELEDVLVLAMLDDTGGYTRCPFSQLRILLVPKKF
jgi:hypothetical protein